MSSTAASGTIRWTGGGGNDTLDWRKRKRSLRVRSRRRKRHDTDFENGNDVIRLGTGVVFADDVTVSGGADAAIAVERPDADPSQAPTRALIGAEDFDFNDGHHGTGRQ